MFLTVGVTGSSPFEAFLSELIIQNLMQGMYIDVSEIKNNFKHEHFKNIVLEYCKRYGII